MWLLFAVANWIDLAVQGRDHMSAVAAAILLLGTGAAYVTAQRPRIIADEAGVTVRNPLRDHRIGWTGVAQVDLAGLLRVHCEWGQHRKVISAWAVPYSKRRQFAAEASARRQARYPGGRRSPLGLPSGGGRGLAYGAPGPGPEASAAEAEAEKIARMLREQAAAAQAAARSRPPARTEAAREAKPPRERGRRGNRDRRGTRSREHRAAGEHVERPGDRRPGHSRADPAGGLVALSAAPAD